MLTNCLAAAALRRVFLSFSFLLFLVCRLTAPCARISARLAPNSFGSLIIWPQTNVLPKAAGPASQLASCNIALCSSFRPTLQLSNSLRSALFLTCLLSCAQVFANFCLSYFFLLYFGFVFLFFFYSICFVFIFSSYRFALASCLCWCCAIVAWPALTEKYVKVKCWRWWCRRRWWRYVADASLPPSLRRFVDCAATWTRRLRGKRVSHTCNHTNVSVATYYISGDCRNNNNNNHNSLR